ncbi:MAG: hypothetical protein QXS85_00665 [Acidilobaceae archaeon]
MARTLTSAKLVLEALGLRQLDVYRVVRDKRPVDLVRVMDVSSGRVALVDLGTLRESLSLSEYIDRVVSELARAGIRVDERKLAAVKAKLSRS